MAKITPEARVLIARGMREGMTRAEAEAHARTILAEPDCAEVHADGSRTVDPDGDHMLLPETE